MKDLLVIGIAGGTGSGKTTLMDNLVKRFGNDVTVLSHDNYYRRRDDMTLEERAKVNYDEPAALETDLMVRHLDKLRQGEAIECPVYDFSQHNRSNINMFPLILIDGTQNELAVRWLDQQIRDISSVMERGAEQIIREQLCHPKIQVWKGTTPQRAEIGISLAQHQAMAIIEEMGNRCIYDRKELYARFAQIVPSVLNKSSLRPTRNNINEALRCMKLPYRVSYHQQAKGPLRGKYFYRIDRIAR